MALFGDKVSGFVGNVKLDLEIASLESKKKALIKSVQTDIQVIQAKITRKLTEIGSTVYSANISGESSPDMLADLFGEVTALKETIVEKEARIQEINEKHEMR
jgi:hypothetical protein